MLEDTPAMRVLRANFRNRVSIGGDVSAATFALVRDASRTGVSDRQQRKVIGDLRSEGLIPEVTRQ